MGMIRQGGAAPTRSRELPVLHSERPQRRQARQHGQQRAAAYPAAPQRQARHPAEPHPVRQLHASKHPAHHTSRISTRMP